MFSGVGNLVINNVPFSIVNKLAVSPQTLGVLKLAAEHDETIFCVDVGFLISLTKIFVFVTTDLNMVQTALKRGSILTSLKMPVDVIDVCTSLKTWFNNTEMRKLEYAAARYIYECYARSRNIPPIPKSLIPLYNDTSKPTEKAREFYYDVWMNDDIEWDAKQVLFLMVCRGFFAKFWEDKSAFMDVNVISSEMLTPGGLEWKYLTLYTNVFDALRAFEIYVRETFYVIQRAYKRAKLAEFQGDENYVDAKMLFDKFILWVDMNHRRHPIRSICRESNRRSMCVVKFIRSILWHVIVQLPIDDGFHANKPLKAIALEPIERLK